MSLFRRPTTRASTAAPRGRPDGDRPVLYVRNTQSSANVGHRRGPTPNHRGVSARRVASTRTNRGGHNPRTTASTANTMAMQASNTAPGAGDPSGEIAGPSGPGSHQNTPRSIAIMAQEPPLAGGTAPESCSATTTAGTDPTGDIAIPSAHSGAISRTSPATTAITAISRARNPHAASAWSDGATSTDPMGLVPVTVAGPQPARPIESRRVVAYPSREGPPVRVATRQGGR